MKQSLLISVVNICGFLVNCHILAFYLQILKRQISLSMCLENCQSSFLAWYDCLHFWCFVLRQWTSAWASGASSSNSNHLLEKSPISCVYLSKYNSSKLIFMKVFKISLLEYGVMKSFMLVQVSNKLSQKSSVFLNWTGVSLCWRTTKAFYHLPVCKT